LFSNIYPKVFSKAFISISVFQFLLINLNSKLIFAQEKQSITKSNLNNSELNKSEVKKDLIPKDTSESTTDAAEDAANESESSSNTADKNDETNAQPEIEAPSKDLVYTGPRDEDATSETVEVVSTRLKKMDLVGPAPELRISVEDIFKSGHTSIADFLRDNPVSAFGSSRERSGLAANAGAATVDVRGLGSDNTLVLINGIRFPPMSGGDSVDINRIPLAIIKEVIIIKDDLSSIYGSDAIGGVVNIITQKGFDGFQINVGKSFTSLGGGEKFDLNILAGASSAKSNVTFALGYAKKDKIFSRDREWSKNSVSSIGSPGGYRDVGTTPWSVDPNCDPADIVDNGVQGKVCSYNPALASTSLPQIDQLSMLTHIDHKFSEFTEFYSEFMFTNSRTAYTYAPSPGVFNVPSGVADTLGLPDHVNGNELQIRYRTTELGNRDTFQENNFFGVTSGIKHEFFDTWSVNLKGSYGKDRNDDFGVGNAVTSSLIGLIGTGPEQFNPFAPAGSRGSLDGAAYSTSSTQLANFYTADLRFSGELGELFGAPFIMDFGYTHLSRDYNNTVDALSERGEIFTGAGSSGFAKRSSDSLYAQLNGRLSQSIDVYLSGRYDKFSDFGETFNPKLGIKYRPTSNLLFRSTVGTGFKAPALSSLYGQQTRSYETFLDFKACADHGGNACDPQQYLVLGGGNKDLNEIRSFSYSAGFVYEPSNIFDLSIDFWAVNQKGLIAGGSGSTLQAATEAELRGINPSSFGFDMNRDANGFLDSTNPIKANLVNLIDNQSAGLDIGITYNIGLPIGSLILNESASIRLWEKSERFPGLGMRDDIDYGLLPEWRNQLSAAYKLLQNTFQVTVVSTDNYLNSIQDGYIDSYSQFNFAYSYSGFKDVQLTLGVVNFLATTPPLDKTSPTDQFNETLYSERGPEGYLRYTQYF
jgi:iron complex outermembrane recepter protein